MFEQITVKQLELKKQRNVKRGHFFREERFLLRRDSFEKRDSFWEERFLLRREIYFERRDFFWEDFFQEHISFIFSFKRGYLSWRILSRRDLFRGGFFREDISLQKEISSEYIESKWWQRGDNSWWATSLEKEQP